MYYKQVKIYFPYYYTTKSGGLAAVAVALEVEPQLENVVVELTAEAALVRVLPLAVHDLEGNVLVGRPRVEPQNRKVPVVLARSLQQNERVTTRGRFIFNIGFCCSWQGWSNVFPVLDLMIFQDMTSYQKGPSKIHSGHDNIPGSTRAWRSCR